MALSFHPLRKKFIPRLLFFNRPTAITDFPDLIRGFILAEAWRGDKNNQKENKKRHRSNLKE
jgi:hypothetical protein